MKNDEKVICIYDENGPSINEKILELFKKYLDKELNKYGLLKLDYLKKKN